LTAVEVVSLYNEHWPADSAAGWCTLPESAKSATGCGTIAEAPA
jgi:hypothetical protein